MEFIDALFDPILGVLYTHVIEPLLYGIGSFLNLLISPLGSYAPRHQILAVAPAGALIARVLAKIFGSRREKKLQREFQKRLSTLKFTDALGDDKLKKAVRKGIHQAADEVYEKIVLDKFFEMGISYFLPLFFFLIWLQYDRFTPEKLNALTGSPHAWVTASGLELSAAYVYLYFFNSGILSLWIAEFGIRRFKRKFKKAENHTP